MFEIEHRYIPARFQFPRIQQRVEIRQRQVAPFEHERRSGVQLRQQPFFELPEQRLRRQFVEQHRLERKRRTGRRTPRHIERTLDRITVHSGEQQPRLSLRRRDGQRRRQGGLFIDIDAGMIPPEEIPRTGVLRRKQQQAANLPFAEGVDHLERLIPRCENLPVDQKAVDTGNVQTFYGCFVEKLIMDHGRCVGLYARDAATGEYIKCNASKGVILSTGDYSQNTKMLKHFCPEVIENNIQCLFTNVDVEGNFTNQGDGIQLGMWAGAQVQQSHAPMIHHMGGGADLAGVGVMGNAGFLNLDLNGKRFMNEDLPGQQLENQIELQKNRESWQIFDSNWPEQLPYMPAAHGGACYYEDYASEDEGPKNNTTYRNYKSPYQLEAAVADGRAVKADTLEELVAKIYPDDTAAQQTALDSIQRYNELAKAGYDEDFHKPASRMWAVENGPFYADKFTTALLLVCIGGLESDEDCHTFDADRNVIPGLYVAGNIQGNRFATEYPIGLKGVSHSMAMYYGYVAGKNALKNI